MSERRPILCLDFDGVLHSYTSGWKGAAVIPDPPVPGAIDFLVLAMRRFEVHILSSRSHQWGGRRAMKRWLRQHVAAWDASTFFPTKPEWVQEIIAEEDDFGDTYESTCRRVARRIVASIHFPRHKPPAHVTLDDRAITFTGGWPSIDALLTFKPWNKP